MFSQIHIWNASYFKKIIQKNYMYYMTSVVLISMQKSKQYTCFNTWIFYKK